MNKYLVAGGVVSIVALLYFLMPSEKISNPITSTSESVKEKKVSQLQPKNSTFEDAKSLQTSLPKSYPEISNEKREVRLSQKSPSNLVNRDALQEKSQKISNFIDNNGLQPIQSMGDDLEIFAKNPPQKNEFAPPMPPTLIKVKFKDKEELVPLNSNLVGVNKKIYVVRKNGDNYSAIKEIDTKKLTSFTPPAIGQN